MSEISVVVVGSTSVNSVVGNGDTVNVNVGDQTVGGGNGAAATIQVGTVATIDATQSASITNVGTAYAAKLNFSLPRGYTGATGSTGPANSLSIGSVSTGATAAVSITGTAPSQSLSFVLQPGPTGPANSLSIGSVSTGATAAVSITGAAPSQSISFVLPIGPRGDTGPAGPQGQSGSVNLADETPQPLGAASAGTALAAARADHVHALPSISYSSLTGVPSTFTPAAHQQDVSTITGLQAALDAKQAAGSYATLVSGTVPSSQLPSYVDDVVEYAALSAFPATGETGKIYVARDTNKTYRWSGSTYVEISASPGSTDSVTEGSTNLYFTSARAASAAPVQSVAGRTGTITLAQLGSSGTASATTFLRGDGAWAAVSGGSGSGDIDGGYYTGTIVYDRTITITQQPTDQTAVSGAATITVSATVSPTATLSYRWQKLVGTAWTDISGAVTSSLALSGLTSGTNNGDRYRCVISAPSAASVTSGESLLGVSPTAPGVPTNITAVRGDSSVTLSWTAPSNGGSAITDYVVQYYPDFGVTRAWTTFSDGTSTATAATLSSLATGSYKFRIAAVNVIGQGEYGEFTENFGVIYVAPQSLQVDSNNASATSVGIGDSISPLVVTFPLQSTGGYFEIKTKNTSQTVTVNWSVNVTTGSSVMVYKNNDYMATTANGTISGGTILSPNDWLHFTPTQQLSPCAFTVTAQV